MEEYTDEIGEKLGELEMICCEEDPTYEYDVKVTKILESLGFPATQHGDLMSTITGGDKVKVLLAQVLFPKPDILFLDEPTNNLDIETIGWLENQLQHHDGTMVVISHDRHFLNAVCTHIFDVDFKKRLESLQEIMMIGISLLPLYKNKHKLTMIKNKKKSST